ncbi:MAG: hypothetical protein ACI8RD_012181, partial [Bacillariaceae sp.]|jgi:hypothetical protein
VGVFVVLCEEGRFAGSTMVVVVTSNLFLGGRLVTRLLTPFFYVVEFKSEKNALMSKKYDQAFVHHSLLEVTNFQSWIKLI